MGEELDNKKEKQMQIKKQSTELEQTIKDSEKELEALQKSCLHPKEDNKFKDINPESASNIRKVCGICGLLLGYPTKEEMEDWTGATREKEKDTKTKKD